MPVLLYHRAAVGSAIGMCTRLRCDESTVLHGLLTMAVARSAARRNTGQASECRARRQQDGSQRQEGRDSRGGRRLGDGRGN